MVVVLDCGLKVEPLDGSAEATQLSPKHAVQHATPRPVSQSVSQCMQSSDTPATGSPVEPAGATGRAGRSREMLGERRGVWGERGGASLHLQLHGSATAEAKPELSITAGGGTTEHQHTGPESGGRKAHVIMQRLES